MATPYQINLKSIKVIENGTIEQENGKNGFIATLHNPDVGKPALVSIRQISLEDNVEYDYATEPYNKQIIFKELILGDALIEIEITSIKEATKFSKTVHKLFKTVFSKAGSFIPGSSIVTGVLKQTSDSFFERIEPEDKIEVIGHTTLLIKEGVNGQDLHLNLNVPKEIKLSKLSRNESGQSVYSKKTIRKGFTNAHVILELKKLN